MIFKLISFFSGFLTSNIIDTSLGEFREWAIVIIKVYVYYSVIKSLCLLFGYK